MSINNGVALSPKEKLIQHANDDSGQRNIAGSDVLDRLLEEVEPFDFKSRAYSNYQVYQVELNALQAELTNLDGTLNKDEALDSQHKRAQYLANQIDRMKLTEKDYQIYTVENVVRLAQQNGWGVCKNRNFVYCYNGEYWSVIDTDEFKRFLGDASEKMGVPERKARPYMFRRQLYEQFLETESLPTPKGKADVVLINLLNGTYEITPRETKLRDFNQSDFLTYQLPFAYDPQAEAPIFQAYLNRVLPDQTKQAVLAEYLGYVFIKNGGHSLKLEKALILYGSGANGKSVFFEVMQALLGSDNVSNYSLQSLTNENGYYRAKLANKLVNYASEISSKLETALFKQMVSGEPVEARLPYGEPFRLQHYAKLVFNCNELPKDVEHTNAYFRRLLIVRFDVVIPTHEQDRELHRKIIENELAGVFNWVLAGLTRLLKNNDFTKSEAIEKAVSDYQLESDSVAMYLDESGYAPASDCDVYLSEIYKTYRAYCTDNGFAPCSTKTFSKRLANLGYQSRRVNAGIKVYASKKNVYC